jgi:hypothetical protein
MGYEQRDSTNNEVQLQRQRGVEFGPFGSWLRADNNSFQPGLNPNLLLEFDHVQCRIRTGQSFNPATNEEAVNQWSPRNGRGEESSWQQAVQSASDKWNEIVENEKTKETKLPVMAAVNDEVPAMEHNKYFETVDIGSPANDL